MNSDVENRLKIDEEKIEQVESSLYLSSIISPTGIAEEDLKILIRKANRAFVQLHLIWRSKNLLGRTKI